MEEQTSKEFTLNKFQPEQTQFPQFGNTAGYAPGVGPSIQEHIEGSKSNGWGSQLGGFLQDRGKRIGIVVAVILLFATISYLTNKKEAPSIMQNENSAKTEVDKNFAYPINKNANDVLKIKLGETGQVIRDTGADLKTGPFSSEEEKDAMSITKEAEMGEGITHLARHAIKDYLLELGKSLSPEQKIYAEDYVQNKIGSEGLKVGQKLSFSRDLLKEAVARSELLKPWQIQNLTQYSAHARF